MNRTTIKTPDEPSGNDQNNRTVFESAEKIAEDNARMVAAITGDYRAGRVTVCDGWVVSKTEGSLTTTRSSKEGFSAPR